MRKIMTATLSVYALAVPVTGLAAARVASRATATPAAKAVTRKLTGISAQAGQWGSVQVVVTQKTTAASSSRRASSRFIDLGGQYSYHTSRSQFIMTQALPILRQEFLNAQSAHIQLISGATFTSDAFEQSLQSALLRAAK
jgi:hypothetical protein